MLIILYEMYWTLKTHFIWRFSIKKNIWREIADILFCAQLISRQTWSKQLKDFWPGPGRSPLLPLIYIWYQTETDSDNPRVIPSQLAEYHKHQANFVREIPFLYCRVTPFNTVLPSRQPVEMCEVMKTGNDHKSELIPWQLLCSSQILAHSLMDSG